MMSCINLILILISSFLQLNGDVHFKRHFQISSTLNSHLNTVKDCLIQITNHQRIDIPNLSHPVLWMYHDYNSTNVLWLHPFHFGYNRRYEFSAHDFNTTLLVDGMGNFYEDATDTNPVPRNHSQQTQSIFDCKRSSFIHGGPDQDDHTTRKLIFQLCTKINFVRFSGKIKQWHCEAYFDVLPPSNHFDHRMYTDRWFWEFHNTTFGTSHSKIMGFVPTAVTTPLPRLHFLVTNDINYSGFKRTIFQWMNMNILEISRPFGKSDIYFVIWEPVQSILKEPVCFNGKDKMVVINPRHQRFRRHACRPINSYLISYTRLINDFSHHTTAAQSFDVQWPRETQVQCDFTKLHSTISRVKHILNSRHVNEMQEYLRDHVWRVVVGNGSEVTCFSDKKNKRPISVTSVVIENIHVVISNETFPTTLPTFAFRFVSCGRSDESGFPFKELLTSFDSASWRTIGIVYLLALPATLVLISRLACQIPKIGEDRQATHFLQNTLSCLKLILEQGNPFIDSTANNSNLAILLVTTYLGSLVMSNAYKQENILKMVQPRGKVPHELISQLIEADFTIYTRFSKISVVPARRTCEPIFSTRCWTRQNWTIESPHHLKSSNGIKLRTDVALMENTAFKDKLFNRTTTLKTSVISRGFLNFWQEKYGTKMNWETALADYQKSVLFKQLMKCEKRAAIVPELQALEIGYGLMETKGKDQVYVGKEAVFQYGTYLQLSPFQGTRKDRLGNSAITFSPLLAKRLQGFVSGGILMQWQELAKYFPRIRRLWKKNVAGNNNETEANALETKVTAATINGNILIVFAVLSGGILVAVFMFLTEICLCILTRTVTQSLQAREQT